jgi:hypothetical protein
VRDEDAAEKHPSHFIQKESTASFASAVFEFFSYVLSILLFRYTEILETPFGKR